MIFKTIDNGSDIKVVTAMKARKIAQDELTASIAKQEAELLTDKEALRELENAVVGGIPYEEAYAQSMNNASIAAKEHAVATKGAAGSTDTFVAKQKVAQAELKATATAAKGTSMAMKALSIAGNMLVMFAVTEAISLISKAIDDSIHADERAIELTEELKSKHAELKSEYESHKQNVEELASSYEKLSNGVDTATNTNLSLSEDDYKTYLDITNKLAEVFPSLKKTLDDNGNAILTLGQNGRTASEDLAELLRGEEDLNNYKISQDITGLFSGVKAQVKESKQATEEYNASCIDLEEKLKNIKKVSNEGLDFSSEDGFMAATGQIGVDDEYFNALATAVNNFQNSLSNTRRVELSDVFEFPTVNIDENGKYSFWLKTYSLTPDEIEQLQNEIKVQTGAIVPVLQDNITTSFNEKDQKEKSAELAWKDFLPSLVSTTKTKGSFKGLAVDSFGNEIDEFGEDIQSLIIQMISNLDMDVANEMGEDPYNWVRDNIIFPFTQLDNSDRQLVSETYKKLFELNPNDLSEVNQSAIDELIAILAEKLGKTETEIRLNLGFEVDKDLQTKYDEAIEKSTKKFNLSKSETESIFTELGIDTFAEIDTWNKIVDSVNTATEAKKKYAETDIYNGNKATPFSKPEMISAINDMSEGFEGLDKIFSSISDKKPFDFKLLDDKGFKEAFSGLEGYADFVETISSNSDNIDACKGAFNELVTEWIESTGILDKVDESTAQLTISMLENMNVENAEEVVMERLNGKTEALALQKQFAAKTGNELVDATGDEVIGFLNEAGASEIAKQYLFRLIAQEQVFNNQNLDTSGKISALKELATQYGQTALAAKIAHAEEQAQKSHRSLTEDDYASFVEDVNNAINEVEVIYNVPKIDSGSGSGSKSKYKKDEETKEIDGIKRKVDLLRESYEKLNNEANDSDNHYSTQLNFLNAAITKEEDLIALEKEAAKAYKAQWEAKSAGLSAEEKDLIMNGSTDIKQFSGKKYNEVTEAQSAWDKYKSMLDSIETDEEKLLGSQKNRYQKKIELIQDEVDTLKDKADYSRIDYHTQIAYLDEALAKSKNLMKTMSEKADEAKRKWNEAKNNIASIDIARIMNNDLDINNYDNKEYASRLEEASKLYGEYLNSEKELDEQVKSDAELQKEAYEKAIEYITAQQELFSNKNASIQSDIDLIDELGGVVGADVYQDMINNNEKLIDLYEQQREEAEDYLSELDDDCPEYYEALSEIEDCNDAIKNCKIEQVKWNEEIKRLPVERLSKYLSILGYIKQDLQNFIDEQASLNIATTKDQYQGLVDISKKQIDKLLEQQKNLKNLLSEYSYGSEKFNDVSGEIQDIDNEISELIQSQNDWNRSMLEIPVNKLTEAKEQLQNISDALSNTISDYDTAISAVGSIIDKQVETLNAEKGAIEDKYTDRINPLQEELDLLKAKTEEENLQLALEEKQAALEKAKQNTNNKVMKNGVFEYRADIEEIQNAQKELEDAVYNKKVNDLESQISGLEEERDKLLAGYDEQIEKLDKIKDRWSSISSDIKLAADAIKANELLGAGWENKVLTGNDDGIYNSMKEMYSLASNQKDQYDKLITQSEYIADLMSQYIEKWQNGAITYDQAISGVNDLLTKLQTGFSNSDYLDSLIGLSNGNSLAEILTNMQSTTSDSLNQFREYLESAQSNKELFTKYASSWEEMKANIAREIEALENAARALENTSNTNKGYSSDSNSSSKKKKSSKKRSSGGGPNVNDHRIVLSGPGMALLKHHTGINAGYVGKEMDSPDKRLKAIGDFINGKSLKQNEVPVVLEKGEVLLNDGQQQMLYKRINELESGTSFSTPTLNCNKMIPSNNNDVSKSMVNNFYGGINIEEAQNVVDIAKGIQNGMFKQILKREIMKPDW